jgi:hypothetical protein
MYFGAIGFAQYTPAAPTAPKILGPVGKGSDVRTPVADLYWRHHGRIGRRVIGASVFRRCRTSSAGRRGRERFLRHAVGPLARRTGPVYAPMRHR